MGSDGSINSKETKAKLDYLKELLTDRTILSSDPRIYIHLGKILEQEILRIRSSLFSAYGIYTITDSDLPEPEGPKVNLQTKVYMPTDATNTFNFVGRILGPGGSTAKCLQQCLGVKIMVRGRGSMRDRKKEEANTGKPNWEHLNENLHVVLMVEDFENRAQARLTKASEYITLFLQESMNSSDKEDKVKQMQLMELSFRREPRSTWQLNNLLDMALLPKSGALFPNPHSSANLLSFGYGYPPTPLYSPLHHNSHHHHHHFGPLGHQPSMASQQTQQQQIHQNSGAGAVQPNHLTGMTHPMHANVNTTAILMGHGLGAGHYPSPYSPNGHTHSSVPTTSSMAGGALAMTPMSYWSGQGMPHLPPEYSLSHMGGYGTAENGTVAIPNGISPSTHTSSGTSHTIFLSQNPPPSSGHEEAIPHCLIQELTSCSLNCAKELESTGVNNFHVTLHGVSATGNTQSTPTVGTPINGNSSSDNNKNNTNSTGSSTNTTKHVMKSRYSPKHAAQTAGSEGHLVTSESAPPRGQGRGAIVTVKVGSGDRHRSNTNNSLIGPSVVVKELKTDGKLSNGELNGRPTAVAVQPTKPPALRAANSDTDWPKLSAGIRERNTTDVTST